MATTDMTRAGQNAPLVKKPEHLGGDIVGTEQLKTLITPPMVKIIQSSADPDLKKTFGVGTVVQTPDNIEICSPLERDGKGEIVKHGSFHFTPIFFYKDWIKWAPMRSKGILPAILGRSTDINSSIAHRAMNANLRLEPLEGENAKFGEASNVEHLNYVCMIEGLNDPTIISFARSAWKIGKDFARQIKIRSATIYGCRFQAIVDNDSNDKGSWHCLRIVDPTDNKGPWTATEDFKKCAIVYAELQKAYIAQALVADYDPDSHMVDSVSERTDVPF